MKQADLNRDRCAAGETASTIAQFGFQIDEPGGRFDSDRQAPEVIDWDVLDAQRHEETWSPHHELAVA